MSLLGEILLNEGKITKEDIALALKHQILHGTKIGHYFVEKGLVLPIELERALASQVQLSFQEKLTTEPDMKKLERYSSQTLIDLTLIPLKDNTWGVGDISFNKKKQIESMIGQDQTLIVFPKNQILYQLHLAFREHLSHQSVYALAESFPQYSAAKVIIGSQALTIYLMLTLCCLFVFYQPLQFLLIINLFITIFLVVSFGFKFMLVWKGSHESVDGKIQPSDILKLEDKDLPVYTILIPMYKEPEVLPIITKSMMDLNYPKDRLDIKIVLEEDDLETQAKAKELRLEEKMEVIIVPKSFPKTKPKACNYALMFARGDYLTIYDAEDKPEPDQLKKAICVFKQGDPKLAVVQARLNYFNADENWLTKMFTMEYSLWFDLYLPALERMGVPIPLGGTSNHFKTSILKLIGGWDPFNVTEDADLGIRFSQAGYKVGVVNSTTLEEANVEYNNWIRQRSRWLKGYMQTYLVHMRTPFKLWKEIGNKAFFSFQFFIGGTFFTALITPILYLVFFWWIVSFTKIFDPIFIQPILYLSILNFLMGNAFFIYIQMIGIYKREHFQMVPWAVTVPVYWIMLSISAYKGLFQLVTNPFYWEKTQHGLSKFTKQMIKEAENET